MLYDVMKFFHIAGVILLIGNVTITAFWKVMADRTGDTKVIAHAQYNVVVADWIFTAAGIALIVIGGYGMAYVGHIDILQSNWLGYGQALFFISGLLWLFVLVPIQVRQSRAAKLMLDGRPPPESYRRDCRLWLIWGIVATVPLVAATYVMIVKG